MRFRRFQDVEPTVRPSRAAKAREPSVPSSSTSAMPSGERPSGGTAKIAPNSTDRTTGHTATKKKSPRCRVSSRRSLTASAKTALIGAARSRARPRGDPAQVGLARGLERLGGAGPGSAPAR